MPSTNCGDSENGNRTESDRRPTVSISRSDGHGAPCIRLPRECQRSKFSSLFYSLPPLCVGLWGRLSGRAVHLGANLAAFVTLLAEIDALDGKTSLLT